MLCQNTSRDGFLIVPLAKQVVNRACPHLLEWMIWQIKGWNRGTVTHQHPCDVKCADRLQRWLSEKLIKQQSHFWSLSGESKFKTFTSVELKTFWYIISPLAHWIWKQLHSECSFDKFHWGEFKKLLDQSMSLRWLVVGRSSPYLHSPLFNLSTVEGKQSKQPSSTGGAFV